MKRSKNVKTVVMIAIMTIVVPMLFAAGMQETTEGAVTGRIITIEAPGIHPAFTIRTTDGIKVAVRTDAKTTSSFPVAALTVGDYLEIVLDGDTATHIRYINPIVFGGIVDLSISSSDLEKPETLTDRFSYTYGYLLLQSFANQGLFFNGGYYLKGAMDGIAAADDTAFTGFYTQDELYANIDAYQNDIWNAGLATQGFGSPYSDLEAIAALPKDDDVTNAFSYTYGFLLTANMLGQGIDVDGPYYVNGAMDFAFGNPVLLDEGEMQAAFSEYQQQVEAEYQAWLEKTRQENLVAADAFLADNATKEGVTTTDSGLQYEVLTPADGPKPIDSDTVEVNYELSMLDGTVVESSYESGNTAHFALSDVIPGFREAIGQMHTGSTIRCWIHPTLGYGENGTQTIQPNALLVFKIELIGIDVPAEDSETN